MSQISKRLGDPHQNHLDMFGLLGHCSTRKQDFPEIKGHRKIQVDNWSNLVNAGAVSVSQRCNRLPGFCNNGFVPLWLVPFWLRSGNSLVFQGSYYDYICVV